MLCDITQLFFLTASRKKQSTTND